jgi:hypothetical protein
MITTAFDALYLATPFVALVAVIEHRVVPLACTCVLGIADALVGGVG